MADGIHKLTREEKKTRLQKADQMIATQRVVMNQDASETARNLGLDKMSDLEQEIQKIRNQHYESACIPIRKNPSTSKVLKLENDLLNGIAEYQSASDESKKTHQEENASKLQRKITGPPPPEIGEGNVRATAVHHGSSPPKFSEPAPAPVYRTHHAPASTPSQSSSRVPQPLPQSTPLLPGAHISPTLPANVPQPTAPSKAPYSPSHALPQPTSSFHRAHITPTVVANPPQPTLQSRAPKPFSPPQNLIKPVPSREDHALAMMANPPNLATPHFTATPPRAPQPTATPTGYKTNAPTLSVKGPAQSNAVSIGSQAAFSPWSGSSPPGPVSLTPELTSLPPPPRPRANRGKLVSFPAEEPSSTTASSSTRSIPSGSSPQQAQPEWKRGHASKYTFGHPSEFSSMGVPSKGGAQADTSRDITEDDDFEGPA